MKKLLAALAISPLALTGCFGASGEDSWEAKKDANGEYIVASISGEGIDDRNFTASDLFEKAEGTSQHYDKVFDEIDFALAKAIYIKEGFSTTEIGELKFAEILEDAKAEVESEKDAVKSQYGNDWSSAWDDFISDKGRDDEMDYIERDKILPIIKAVVDRSFNDWRDAHENNLNEDEYFVWNQKQEEQFTAYLEAAKPLAMRHVLIKFDVDFSLKRPFEKIGDASVEQFEKMHDVLDYLNKENTTNADADGIDWNDFADTHSEDGSAKSGGFFKFEGINSLSSVDEFKYASYDLAAVVDNKATPSEYLDPATLIADANTAQAETATDAERKTAIEKFSRTAQFMQIDGETIAVTLSQFGIHFIGLDGTGKHQTSSFNVIQDDITNEWGGATSTNSIDDSIDSTNYLEWAMFKARTEKNHPLASQKQFHTNVTSATSSWFNSNRRFEMIKYAEENGILTFADEKFGTEIKAHYENIKTVNQDIWEIEFLNKRDRWIEDFNGDHNFAKDTSFVNRTEMEALFGRTWEGFGQ